MHYPHIDPVIIGFGPVAIRWYGLAYLTGFVFVWWLGNRRARSLHNDWTEQQVSDVVFYGALGAVLGGRIGYVFFYGFEQFVSDPVWLFRIWDGGMSFHGGMMGVLVAVFVFARVKHKKTADVLDFVAPLPGIGLFFGRLGNFINGELWGKPTDLPWGFGVPDAQGVLVSRHPSQLYEATLEGLVLFLILLWFTRRPRPRLAPTGLFLLLYGCGRFLVEWVRLPDANIGYLAHSNWLTMGMLLTTPMILIGAGIMIYAYRRNVATGNLGAVKA